MKLIIFTLNVVFLLLLFSMGRLYAQNNNCTFKDPLLKIDFGTNVQSGINSFPLKNYRQVNSRCPDDGNFSFVSSTSKCFNDEWLTLVEDHTRNDKNGKMLLVNASPDPGVFFNTTITGLLPHKTYEIAGWMTNVCRIAGWCPPLLPNIIFKLLLPDGRKVVSFQTGLLGQTASPRWTRYAGIFTTPANVTTLILTMEDISPGGCGNDFAIDDITVRECVMPIPVTKQEVKPEPKPVKSRVNPVTKATVEKIPPKLPPVKKQPAVVAKREINKTAVKLPPVKNDVPVAAVEKQVKVISKNVQPEIKESLPAPKLITTRANPLIKQIETAAGEMVIDLYDNGEIDGDTVSVYHNSQLIVSRARLSAKATSFRIKVDAVHPHHELIMVAHNLGSIPPNTSMMIITTSQKRYEVFISSSEEKNAKIMIDLKE